MTWTDEARKAIDEIEQEYDIEVVSIEHHQRIYDEMKNAQAENEDLQYEVDKLSGVLVCANNNCERRDKVIAELKAENERYREALIKIAEYNHPSNETIQIARDILGVKEPPALNASRKAGE